MKKIQKIGLIALLATTAIAMNANASRNVERSIKHTENEAEEALVDTMITTKVKTLLLREPELSALKIHVTTHNQIVTLKGDVNSEFEENIAINIAESVKEVKSVESNLRIKYS
jgi:osmotically-inducible protein OsmY